MLDSLLENQITECAAVLKNGGVAAFPTDTVYGLGACYDNIKAVENLFKKKKRDDRMALPLLLPDRSWISKLAIEIPGVAWDLVDRFMPGALTLILKKASIVPSLVSGGLDTVALRIPGHDITLRLIERTGCPITGTSANISGMPSTHTAAEVKQQFGNALDFILDGGKTPGGIESTIVDLTVENPVIRRFGAINRETIETVCAVSNPKEDG